ncbi:MULTISPECIES: ATP-binding cassette domain-containing protein [unclassified Paenibacillus]|uniref:ATP-binding cassette domain-containing protein n=1 Tax=unclassified Paenibacillus TaxID=185978 RepID=UPI001AEA6832|nr:MULTISPECIES: ATP-binding cassette domain-containing protein [unclassified Paenibacillus]MBP1155559.1 energy-coupling factor transport system ATP-binding protein [Paenibacillus sp. PvP091]MBP1169055.1 energy-coupling factor transport system ATP-binding protein [Paenibacillus sp. PvR098]MBP2440083.1 energy-coupling factor transport system ATP-binding protein [Paenibacillus sp. PvP052]
MPINVSGLTVYADHRRSRTILNNIHCSIQDRTLTLVIGKAGSGKTTLLRTLAGLSEIGEGNVYYDDLPLWKKGKVDPSLLLRNALAFQFPEHQLFARTVQGEFDYSLRAYRLPKPEKLRRIAAAMDGQRLPTSYLALSPFTLSGGQKRRVALASIMAAEAPWLLLDEPSAGLDSKSVARLKEELAEWKQQRGVVLVTHDLDTFLPIADKVLIMEHGQVVAGLTPEELAMNPHLLVQAGIGLTGVMELSESLREAGLLVPAGAFTPEQIAGILASHMSTSQQLGETQRQNTQPIRYEPPAQPQRQASDSLRRSFVYGMDAKLKWLIYMLISVGIVIQTRWEGLWVALLFAAGCTAFLLPEDRRKLKRLAYPLLFFMAVAAFISGVQISFAQGIEWTNRFDFSYTFALETLRRLTTFFEITLIGLVFTLSTSTSSMKQGLEIALRPLKRLKVPTEMLALAASLMLRFIPLILEETERFAMIAKARGKRMARRGQISMADIPVFVIPLLIALFQAVEELILAMELKGYMTKSPQPLPRLNSEERTSKLALLICIIFVIILIGIRVYV